jgi:hypothetical protein
MQKRPIDRSVKKENYTKNTDPRAYISAQQIERRNYIKKLNAVAIEHLTSHAVCAQQQKGSSPCTI